jgi:hypothetical protein
VTERLINPKGPEVAAPNGTSQVYHTETGAKLIQVLLKFLVATVRFDVP